MPDVVGKRLDIAISDVERAGFTDDVEVLGGGTFGIVDESNWLVCSQEPADGTTISTAPRITVDRSCDAGDALEPEANAEEAPEDGGDAAEDPTPAAEPKPVKKKKREAPAAVADTFVMPALVGMNLQRAQNQLQARGSFLLTQTDGTGEGRFQMLDYGWKVCAQAPAAGTVTDIVRLVELVTVKLHEAC
jgi:beta-lactam-binding protein with PASTA domain